MMNTGARATLTHGYTLADVDRLARISAIANRSESLDPGDTYQLAWSAMVEALYAADSPPTERDMMVAGKAAIREELLGYRQSHGFRDRRWDAGAGSSPKFATYWQWHAANVHSHEDRIVESLALPAVLGLLTGAQWEALSALVAHDGDRRLAAAALGVSLSALDTRLLTARQVIRRAWMAPETPAGNNRVFVRTRRSATVPECGTLGAAKRHRRLRETVCEVCRKAESARVRDSKAKRLAAAAAG